MLSRLGKYALNMFEHIWETTGLHIPAGMNLKHPKTILKPFKIFKSQLFSGQKIYSHSSCLRGSSFTCFRIMLKPASFKNSISDLMASSEGAVKSPSGHQPWSKGPKWKHISPGWATHWIFIKIILILLYQLSYLGSLLILLKGDCRIDYPPVIKHG